MPRLSLPALRFSRRWLVAVVWLLSLAFTAWVIARIVLRLSAPAPLAVSPPPLPSAEEAAQQIALAAPFGGAPAVAGEAASAPAQFRLIGVATGFGIWPGFALLQPTDGPARAVALGDELAPGVKLVALRGDTAEIERNGSRETLPLSRENAAVVSDTLTATPRPPVQPPPQQQTAPPPVKMPPPVQRLANRRPAPPTP
ncbi:MAG: hypothetical protein IK051_05860 [Rhodocyclaceae bacterium]|nr:hypothetical protein [Rhodocyclaceae bacterium]